MREHHLVHLKLSLTLLVGVLWMVNVSIDESLMAEISGASPPDLNFWGTKGAGFALIAAVGLFVALIPSGRWLGVASQAAAGLAGVSAAYWLLQDTTSGHMGRYLAVVVAAACIITIGLLAGVAVSARRERRERQEELSSD